MRSPSVLNRKKVEKVIPAPPPVPAGEGKGEENTMKEKGPEGDHQPKVEETETKQQQQETTQATGPKVEADAQRDRVAEGLFNMEDN